MGTLFSDTLKRLRKESGFSTAYRFYHDNGGAPGQELSQLHKALGRSLAQKKFHLTPTQFSAMLYSPETYKCSLLLTNGTGAWTSGDIAKALGLKKAAAGNSLRRLAKAKVLKEVRKDFYRARMSGAMIEYPDLRTVEPALRDKLREYTKDIEQEGSLEWGTKGIVRADAVALQGLYPLMALNVSTAETYSVTEKTDNTAFFYVVSKVVRLWDF